MDLRKLKTLIDLVSESNISELEIAEADGKVRIVKAPGAAPAPAISGPSALSIFDGTDPNGTWNLWVRDEFGGDSGTMSGGWCLNIIVSACGSDAECQDSNVCNGFEACVAGS